MKRIALGISLVALLAVGGYWFVNGESASSSEPRIPAAQLSQLLGDASPRQETVLADGIITQDEYEAAVNGTAACLRAAGVAVEGPRWDGRYLRLVYSAPSAEAMADARAVYQDCFATHEREVAQAWTGKINNYEQPDLDQRAKHWASMVSCLRAGGLALPAGATFDQFSTVLNASEENARLFANLMDTCTARADREAGAL